MHGTARRGLVLRRVGRMSLLEQTLANLAPGVTYSRDLKGRYNPRWGLAIYYLPMFGWSPQGPGIVLGEALASRSGLGCTLLEGIPVKIPEGAVVVAEYSALKASRPDLLDEVPELREPSQYAVKVGKSALVTSPSREGLAMGMQTLAMLILRHPESVIPGALVVDMPLCQYRGLAVELVSGEIGVNLLMQIASFAATFKANRLHLILDRDFDPNREIPGIDTFIQTCESFGIALGIRVPWLRRVLSGEMKLVAAWTGIRAAARAFGATQAAFDDLCPIDASMDACQDIVDSLARGEAGLKDFSLDAEVLARAKFSSAAIKAMGVGGWHRQWEDVEPPTTEFAGIPLRIDVQAPLAGFSGHDTMAFFNRLDTATTWLRRQERREILISFRDIGVSHMWQNLLYPAATGLISAWGRPMEAGQSAWMFASLLYGELAMEVMEMWNDITAAFPPGLSAADEMAVRRTAFGHWPEDEATRDMLSRIDWHAVAENVKKAAESLKRLASALTRNSSTLIGAKLSLYALSWLHSFVTLAPELERRRREKDDADGRTEPIANELYGNFLTWQANLQELAGESGLEISEMPLVESMGLRLKGMCEGIFE